MAGLDPRAAVELAEQVADVHVYGPLADEEVLGDLAVGPADGDVAQDLELAAGQLDAVGGRGGAAAEPLGDRLAQRRHLFGGRGGERAGAELGGAAVGVAEPLQRLLALSGGGEGDAGPQFDLRPLVRGRQVAVQLDRAGEVSAAPAASPSSRASSPTAWASAATASSWPPSEAICPSAAAQSWASLRRPCWANQLAAQRIPQTA